MTELLQSETIYMADSEREDTGIGPYMNLSGHIGEFRKRLIYILFGAVVCTIICLFLSPKLINYIKQFYTSTMISESLQPRLLTLSPSDGFITYIRISVLAGLIMASPWIYFQVWRFIAVGLYPEEKKLINIAVPVTALLFISGSLFFLNVVAPLTLKFFIVFNKKMLGVESAFTFEKYISFIVQMILVFGLAFQSPIAILFLNRAKLISLKTMSKSRKYVILVVFIIGALVTPPDFVSQVMLAVPLYLLFELGILLSRVFNKPSPSS